jgi:hypothetical protein
MVWSIGLGQKAKIIENIAVAIVERVAIAAGMIVCGLQYFMAQIFRIQIVPRPNINTKLDL